ncbi:MAG TPA: nucleotide sugar dehydrogenase [Gemmataceae bacterium]|nr:nucleotide sugar dehydrogenase [Gemmataceae bacterium]
MRITVYGLWHLGCVTAACLAEAGFHVTGLDPEEPVVADLRQGRPPLHEPGLAELTAAGLAARSLTFTTSPDEALRDADVLWVTFDTPVNEQDEADLPFVRERLEAVAPHLRPGTVVLISSQVPVGFTRALQEAWHGKGLHFAYSPENLRLGKALDVFRKPERVIVGAGDAEARARLGALFAPFCDRVEWMAVESAEMTKHALNAFLATSVTFINELARLCEAVGADAKEVERGLKSEARIGPRAYLSPGAAFAGGTLARDVRFLVDFGRRCRISTPLFQGVLASNQQHKSWTLGKVCGLLAGCTEPVVAVLGLTYKPGTSTLRRSASVELCCQLRHQGVQVRAHDPAVTALPGELAGVLTLCPTAEEALRGADVAVVATEWPAYRALAADQVARLMRRPCVIDPTHFLAAALAADPRLTYVATGRGRAAA